MTWNPDDLPAVRAEQALRAALATAGITFPSLGVDVASFASGAPLVSLGRLRAEDAERLAEVIRRGAAPGL
ncbi:hypothetical protein GCM10009665_68800 [Kitasatospora nipponensis]|uniref:Uncharacterized protein n=1 Tax=Kitasatospora nipponensis TaxID=258049 RepID=A0ABN1X0G6_9ACTN